MLAAMNRVSRLTTTSLSHASRPTPASPVQVSGAVSGPAIELRLKSLDDLFDPCCASPLHERQLNATVEAHIVAAAKDLPATQMPCPSTQR